MISDCTISSNTAQVNGGGIYLRDYSDAEITNSTISGNTADLSGGGICCRDYSNAKITACTIQGNKSLATGSEAQGGGGIFCNNSSPIITECTIKGNKAVNDSDTAGGSGGGVHLYNSSPTITGCTIGGSGAGETNRAFYKGGGIYSGGNSGTPLIDHCTITYNHASGRGGGLACYNDGTPTVTHCIIRENDANTKGGGMWLGSANNTNRPIPKIINCTISANVVNNNDQYYGGGGIYCEQSDPKITNCTIFGNVTGDIYAYQGGGGIYCLRSDPTVTNCILWGDVPDEIFLHDSYPSVMFSDVEEGTDEPWFGLGCIDYYPDFVSSGSGNFRLFSASLCIDAGDNSAPSIPDVDLDDHRRIWKGKTTGSVTVDMGAYEYGSITFAFTDMVRDSDDDMSLTWNSTSSAEYSVYYSDDDFSESMTWDVLASGINSGGTSTTWEDTSVPTTTPRYYKVLDEEQSIYTDDILGLMRMTLASEERYIVTNPFEAFDGSLDALIGDQLTGNANQFFSDTIESWNGSGYERSWYDSSVPKWKDWTTGGDPTFQMENDTGYWIAILSFNPSVDLYLFGRVTDESRTIQISVGKTLCGSMYPVDVELEDSELVTDGFTGNSSKYFSDTVEWWNNDTDNYDRAWYDTSTSSWKDWSTESATSDKFEPTVGFWITVLSFNEGFTWTYPKPY